MAGSGAGPAFLKPPSGFDAILAVKCGAVFRAPAKRLKPG